MNQRLRQNLVSFWTLMVCLIGVVLVVLPTDAAAYQQGPTWRDGICVAADDEVDGDDVARRVAETTATRNGGVDERVLKISSLERLTRSQPTWFERPHARPDLRGPPKLLRISGPGHTLSARLHSFAVLASTGSPQEHSGRVLRPRAGAFADASQRAADGCSCNDDSDCLTISISAMTASLFSTDDSFSASRLPERTGTTTASASATAKFDGYGLGLVLRLRSHV